MHRDLLTHVSQSDLPDAETTARAEAGRAVRDIGHALVGHHAPVELLEQVAQQLDELTTQLSVGAARSRADASREGRWDTPPADGEVMNEYDERPISGRASPWGLDLTVVRDGDEVVARCTLRSAHEGAPTRSHGGIVAAMFDDVYGFVLTIMRQPAFTGELSVRYVAGTPIGVPLECRVRLAEQVGRKLYMTGELTAAGSVVATSKATFIAIDPSVFEHVSRSGTGG
jgi:acyl-coenzyme A thioesterase PaaI-like protein